MNQVKKTFLLSVVSPIALAALNWLISGRNFLPWAYHRINEISMTALIIAFFGSLLTIYLNYKSVNKNKIWFVIPTLSAIFTIGYWYIIKSLSSFGF